MGLSSDISSSSATACFEVAELRPCHAAIVKGLGEILDPARGEPWAQHLCDGVTVLPARALACQRGAELRFQCLDGVGGACDLQQVAPLPVGQANDHDALAIGAKEILPICAIQRIAGFGGAICRSPQPLRSRPDGRALRRRTSLSARSTAEPWPWRKRLRSAAKSAENDHVARDAIPGGQRVRDGFSGALGTGCHGKAQGRVHGIIHRRAACAIARQRDHAQIGAAGRQGFVIHPAAHAQIW